MLRYNKQPAFPMYASETRNNSNPSTLNVIEGMFYNISKKTRDN